MRGIKLLLDGGFLPIITAMQSWPIEPDKTQLAGFKTGFRPDSRRHSWPRERREERHE
jgi:hypothetical protein